MPAAGPCAPENPKAMKKIYCGLLLFLLTSGLRGQDLELGMQTNFGFAHTTFKGDLAGMVGFSEFELTQEQLDTAFARFDLNAPRWLRELFPGIRVEVDQEVAKQLTRSVRSARFFFRYKFVGGSFTISDPRLTEVAESQKLKNQLKAVSLALGGRAEELAEHLGRVALADAQRIDPFFEKRYDLEGYVHLKKLFYGDRVLLEWGRNRQNTIDLEAVAGLRFSADPSPVVDLGSILFIRDRLDELMEGGILGPVENTTDEIARAVQNVVFGKFKDPRVVPSMGWFGRVEAPFYFGGSFALVTGAEMSVHKNLAVQGTNPMFSFYGYAGIRLGFIGKNRK